MDAPRSGRRLALSAIGILTGLIFLGSLVSWVPFSLVAPFVGPQRIERAESGFAISLPLDWEHADAAGADPDAWWDSDVVDDVRVYHDQVVAEGGLLLARPRSPFAAKENCFLYDFTATAALPLAWTSLVHATTEAESHERDPEVLDAEATFLDLGAGESVRIDTLGDDGWDQSGYFFKMGPRWFQLVCGAEVPPDDRWQSIAESLEFLPVLEARAAISAPEPERIERPDVGVAISLPYHWEYALGDELDPDAWYDAEEVDDIAEAHEERLAAGLLLKARSYLPLESTLQWCDVGDATYYATSWTTLEDAEADYGVWWKEDPDTVSFETAYHDLPAGRTLSIDNRWQDGIDASEYVFTDGDSWFWLGCSTLGAPPEDRWLSIAETFEFLPAEE